MAAIFFCLPFFLLAATPNTWALGVSLFLYLLTANPEIDSQTSAPTTAFPAEARLPPCLFCCFEGLQIVEFSFNGPLYLEISF